MRHVGVKEDPPGSNRTAFGVWYGENGVPWCNIFVSYCFQIGAGYTICDGFAGAGVMPGKGCAYVPTTEHWLSATGMWVGRTEPQPGDIAIFNWDGGQPGPHRHRPAEPGQRSVHDDRGKHLRQQQLGRRRGHAAFAAHSSGRRLRTGARERGVRPFERAASSRQAWLSRAASRRPSRLRPIVQPRRATFSFMLSPCWRSQADAPGIRTSGTR